ncbi:hypothetical protein BJ944DRAFT_242375 [Cunninghamella echinulata]|nr:hypothetical protein BJ944DRAFT_242375 [Cunninghamella echinulata]
MYNKKADYTGEAFISPLSQTEMSTSTFSSQTSNNNNNNNNSNNNNNNENIPPSLSPPPSTSTSNTEADSTNNNNVSGVKVKSVPIPQPLLLKNRHSRSSFSSSNDETLDSTLSSKHKSINQKLSVSTSSSNSNSSIATGSPTRTVMDNTTITTPTKRKSLLNQVDFNNSTNNNSNNNNNTINNDLNENTLGQHPLGSFSLPLSSLSTSNNISSPAAETSITPPLQQQQQQQAGSYSPKYASPPAGSGGKYMVKSKRASWIDASASQGLLQQQVPSTSSYNNNNNNNNNNNMNSPLTPTSAMMNDIFIDTKPLSSSSSKSRNGSLTNKMEQDNAQETMPGHKSGSLSQLREQQRASAAAVASIVTTTATTSNISSSSPISPDRRRLSSFSIPDQDANNINNNIFTSTQQRQSSLDSYSDGTTGEMDDLNIESGSDENISKVQAAILPSLRSASSPSSNRNSRQNYHERLSSLSSIVTESSNEDFFYSPGSSPQAIQSPLNASPFQSAVIIDKGKTKLTNAASASSSPSRNNAMPSTSTESIPSIDPQQAKRRSSMTVLRNIPSSELANIVSGNSPNPILDAPPSTHSPITTPLLTSSSAALISDSMEPIGPSSVDPSITNTAAYQHSLQSFLRRQLSSKRKSRRPRSSSTVSVDPFQPSASSSTSSHGLDADKDIVEIDLDDGEKTRHRMESHQKLSSPSSKSDMLYNEQLNESVTPTPTNITSITNSNNGNTNRSSLYPALLLDTPIHDVSIDSFSNSAMFGGLSQSQNYTHLSTPPETSTSTTTAAANTGLPQPINFVTSAPELTRWEENKEYDYFNPPNKLINDDENTPQDEWTYKPLVRSSSLSSMRHQLNSDEEYGKRLFMSRSAKVRRWCTLKIEGQDGRRRSSAAARIRRQNRRQSSNISIQSSLSGSNSSGGGSRRNSSFSSPYYSGHSPLGLRSPEARISRRNTKDGYRMPTITVTAHDERILNSLIFDNEELPNSIKVNESMMDSGNHTPMSATGQLINAIPWVDWLEEYNVLKQSEMRRRTSECPSSSQHNVNELVITTPTPLSQTQQQQPSKLLEEEEEDGDQHDKSLIDQPKQEDLNTNNSILIQSMLSSWWNNVKNNAEQYPLAKRVAYVKKRGGHGIAADRLFARNNLKINDLQQQQQPITIPNEITSISETVDTSPTGRHRPALSLNLQHLKKLPFQNEHATIIDSHKEKLPTHPNTPSKPFIPNKFMDNTDNHGVNSSDSHNKLIKLDSVGKLLANYLYSNNNSNNGLEERYAPEAPPPSTTTTTISSYYSPSIDSPSTSGVSLSSLASTPGINHPHKTLRLPSANNSILQHQNSQRLANVIVPSQSTSSVRPPQSSQYQASTPTSSSSSTISERIGYQFYNTGNRMGAFGNMIARPMMHFFSTHRYQNNNSHSIQQSKDYNSGGEEESHHNQASQVQLTIRSRLQFAKKACDSELRDIIDGLNEYVERGLQYVEDMDGFIEKGGMEHNVDDDDDDDIDNESDIEEVEVEDYGEYDVDTDVNRNRMQATHHDTLNYIKSTATVDEGSDTPPRHYNESIRSRRSHIGLELDDIEEQEEGSSSEETNSISNEDDGDRNDINKDKSNIPLQINRSSVQLQQQQQAASIDTGNDMVTLITEDSYLPTPFILTLQELISMAQNVMDTSLDALLEHSGTCADIVYKVQSIGNQWDIHPEWPCREWYVRLLLSLAALNRVLEWWEEERGFWLQAWTSVSPAASSIVPTPTSTTTAATSDTEETAPSLPPSHSVGSAKATPPFNKQRKLENDPINKSNNSLMMNLPKKQKSLDVHSDYANISTSQYDTYQDVLQRAADRSQNTTILLELSLGTTTVQYVSPVWLDVIGSNPVTILQQNISKFLSPDDRNVFTIATEKLLADDSQTMEVQFNAIKSDGTLLELEGKGMLMYDRVTTEPSHTMWVIKPLSTRSWVDRAFTPAGNNKEIEKAGADEVSMEEQNAIDMVNNQLRHRSMSLPTIQRYQSISSTDLGTPNTLNKILSLPPAVCRVCERWVVAAFFEQHSELCVEIHQSEMDITMCNDNLRELRHHIHEMRDEARNELEVYNNQTPEERHAMKAEHQEKVKASKEQDEEDSIFGFELPTEEAPDPVESLTEELNIYEDLLEIIDVALGIGVPGEVTDDESSDNDDRMTLKSLQSPRSKDKMIQVLYWRPPASENPNLTSLIRDVEEISQNKVAAVNRMRDRLEYNERVRIEFQKATQQENGWTEFVNKNNNDNQMENNNSSKSTPIPTSSPPSVAATATEVNETPEKPLPSSNQQTVFNDKHDINDKKNLEKINNEAKENSSSIKSDSDCSGKKSILSRIKSWKSKGASKLAKRRRAYSRKWATALEPISSALTPSTMNIVEMETIDTPIGSPALRPSRPLSTYSINNASSINKPIPPVPAISSSTSLSSSHIPSTQLSQQQQQPEGKSPLSPLQSSIPATRATVPSIKDFDIIKPISKGAFGSVFLAKKRTTGDYYAIKFLKKSDMIAKNQVTNVKAERMILMTQTDSPFVTKLYYTFQSKDYLYLVMEYLNGGDCSALVKVLGRLPEDWARNYLAEVTLGLEYLQSKNIIHR